MNCDQCLQLTVPMKNEYLPMALNHVRQAVALFGAPAAVLQAIEISCEEAITHLLENGEFFEGNETLEITINPIAGGVEIVLHEMGIPFDPDRQPGFTPAQDIEALSTQGMGLFLMQQLMDNAVFTNLGINGIEVRLLKNWQTGPDLEPGEPEAPTMTPQVIDADTERIEVRVARPEDAIEITRCAYRCHGYSFFDARIYDYRQLARDIENGSFFSVVTVGTDGKVLGHIAVIRRHPDDPIVECSYTFVDPNLRGVGISKQIGALVADYVFSNPSIKGCTACLVSNHVYSQKLMASFGAMVCAIRLADCMDTWKFKGIANDLGSQRNSDVVAFLPMDRSRRTVFLPSRHRDIIRQLYEDLGLERDSGDPGGALRPLSGPSQITLDVDENDRDAEITFVHLGDDITSVLRKTLRRLCVQGIVSFLIQLPLEDPATPALVPQLEDLGFFFAGVLPLTRIGDALLLQYLNNVTVDYSKIKIHSEKGKLLLDYIRSCDPWQELDSQ